MTETLNNGRQQQLTSEELIAQAYAAIASYGMHGKPPAPTGKPVAIKAAPGTTGTTTGSAGSAPAPYQQPSRELRSSAPFQPPPPSGAPVSPMGRPIPPSRHAMTTGSPATSRPVSVPGSRNTRPTQQQQPQKKSGWGTMIIWLLIILFFLLGLPYLVLN